MDTSLGYIAIHNPSKPTLLYYAESTPSAVGIDDSFLEGAIKKELKDHVQTIVVYYDKRVDRACKLSDNSIVVPYRRRAKLIEEISAFLDPGAIDFVIVRNTVTALRNALRNRSRYGYKVGFHPTFPHALRRVYEADLTGQARIRSRVEYYLKRFRLSRATAHCDFVVSSSEEMIENSFIRKNMRFFHLHNGVDLELLAASTEHAAVQEGPMRFVYIGNFDIARQLGVVFHAFDELESDNWRIDIFSADCSRATEVIERSMKRKSSHVRVFPAIDRAALFRELIRYDAGLCLIPVAPLYLVSSPLKMIEYYACGIPSIMTPLPACLEAFGDRGCGFFADFDASSIKQTLIHVLSTDRTQLRRMGAIGQDFVMAERNYGKIAQDLAEFLLSVGKLQQRSSFK